MQVAFNPPTENPVLYFKGVGARPAGFRTLISVSPVEYRKQYLYHRMPTYVMPAAPKGGYAKMRVWDHQVWLRNLMTVDPENNNPGEMELASMDAANVALDFYNYCIGGNLGAKEGQHPGVVLCAGDEPTEAEIATAFSTHTAYARWCVNDGQRLAMSNEHHNITDEHRRQAEWLGVDVTWKTKMERVDTKDCVACGGKIPANVLVCRHCQRNLVEFCEEMEVSAGSDEVLAAVLESRKAKRAAQPVTAEPQPVGAQQQPIKAQFPNNNNRRQ
jgi:hypothetical protein